MSDLVKQSTHVKETIAKQIAAFDKHVQDALADSLQYQKQRQEAAKLSKTNHASAQAKGAELTKKLDAEQKKAEAAIKKLYLAWRDVPKNLEIALKDFVGACEMLKKTHDRLRADIDEALQKAKVKQQALQARAAAQQNPRRGSLGI